MTSKMNIKTGDRNEPINETSISTDPIATQRLRDGMPGRQGRQSMHEARTRIRASVGTSGFLRDSEEDEQMTKRYEDTYEGVYEGMFDGLYDPLEMPEIACFEPSEGRPTVNFNGNLFTVKDHAIVKKAIQCVLTDEEVDVIELRYWMNKTPDEIGAINAIPTTHVYRILDEAEQKIKRYCFHEPQFSRAPIRDMSLIKKAA